MKKPLILPLCLPCAFSHAEEAGEAERETFAWRWRTASSPSRV